MRAVTLLHRTLLAAAALVLPLASGAHSAWGAAGTVQPAVHASAGPDDGIEQEPSQDEIDAARATVQQLAHQAETGVSAVASRRQELQNAAQEAGLALETYTGAVRHLAQLQQQEQQQQDLLTLAQHAVDENRGDLGRWAREAYQGGGMLGTHATLNALLQARDGQDVGTTLNVLRRIGTERNHAVDAVEKARLQQASATEAAADASQQAADAAVAAASARAAADVALTRQRTALGRAQSALSGTRSELGKAKQRQTALQAAQLFAAATSGSPVGAGDNRVTGRVGSCAGGDDIQQYPNGQIPVGALCALASSPGHFLRADAAYAFDRLSNAYAQRFGAPICVTDSYRSLAEQISVFARKPGLAARPGTSNHGWGTATDLCGGIQSFRSAQHHWMLMNAPLYGWFHPAWAQATGSKPEPWHWEFAG